MDSEPTRRSRDDAHEECNLPECKLEKQNYEYMRSAARRYLRDCRISYIALAVFFVTGIIILFFIFKNDLAAKPLGGADIGKVKKFKMMVNNILGEEVFYHDKHKTVYLAFKKKLKKENAAEICAATIGGKILSVKSNDEKVNGMLSRTAREVPPFRSFWSSGVISSDSPWLIQWDDSSVTFIDRSHDMLKKVVDGKISLQGKTVTVTNYTNFCNETRTIAELKKAIGDGREAQTFDVIIDYRRRTLSRTDPLGCWIILPEEDEHHLICQVDVPYDDSYLPFDPLYVGKRYSQSSNMTYWFFDAKQSLIDASRICDENHSSLLSFDSFDDEQQFDLLIWNFRDRMFTGLLNQSAEIPIFTAGWYWFDSQNQDKMSWGRANRYADSAATYEKFCDGEMDKAKFMFNKDENKRHFIIIKRYMDGFLSSKSSEGNMSCWKLLPYSQAKIPALEYHFVCQSHEISSLWRKIKAYFGWEDVDVHLG